MTPHPISNKPPAPTRKIIDLYESLRSTLRVWLNLRDSIVWSFCSGTDTPGLDEYDIPTISAHVSVTLQQMNHLRSTALQLAAQMTVRGKTEQALIAEIMSDLLTVESPKFNLSVDNLPGSF